MNRKAFYGALALTALVPALSAGIACGGGRPGPRRKNLTRPRASEPTDLPAVTTLAVLSRRRGDAGT